LREETVRDLRFLDDNDWVKTMLCLMEFMFKEMTLGACSMKRWMSCDEELEEASEQLR
jgi:hypothetical protein